MAHEGWIKLHRKIMSNDIMEKPPLYFKVFLKLLMDANIKDKEIDYNGGKKLIKRGERLTSIRTLATSMTYEEEGKEKIPTTRTISKILTYLVGNDIIFIYQKDKKRRETHYKVLNFDLYQAKNDECETPKKQSLPTNKNEKKYNKEPVQNHPYRED